MFEKKFKKKFENITNCWRGGREGGWRIVIPMPEAINFVDALMAAGKILEILKMLKILTFWSSRHDFKSCIIPS
jgi:hypothetical protein